MSTQFSSKVLENALNLLVAGKKYFNTGSEMYAARPEAGTGLITQTFVDGNVSVSVPADGDRSVRIQLHSGDNQLCSMSVYEDPGISCADSSGFCLNRKYPEKGMKLTFNAKKQEFPCGDDVYFQYDLMNDVGDRTVLEGLIDNANAVLEELDFQTVYIIFNDALANTSTVDSLVKDIEAA